MRMITREFKFDKASPIDIIRVFTYEIDRPIKARYIDISKDDFAIRVTAQDGGEISQADMEWIDSYFNSLS